MMRILYTFELPAPINGITHVAIMEEIRDGHRIKVSGVYGTMDDDTFGPSTIAVPLTRATSSPGLRKTRPSDRHGSRRGSKRVRPTPEPGG